MSIMNHPDHYRAASGYEAIDVIEGWRLGFCGGSILKCICRAAFKGSPVDDLRKAIWYAKRAKQNRECTGTYPGVMGTGPSAGSVARAWGLSPTLTCALAMLYFANDETGWDSVVSHLMDAHKEAQA